MTFISGFVFGAGFILAIPAVLGLLAILWRVLLSISRVNVGVAIVFAYCGFLIFTLSQFGAR